MIVFIFCISLCTSVMSTFFLDFLPLNQFSNNPRLERSRPRTYEAEVKDCRMWGRTEQTPFVIFILHKTSGNFKGMGAILDRRTCITAERVVKMSSLSNLLILAGSRTPWWGRGSQVRGVRKITDNNFDVVLLDINSPWDFNKRVAPISIPYKFYPSYQEEFGDHYGIFGIEVDDNFLGYAVPKSKFYNFAIETLKKSEENSTGCGEYDIGNREPYNDTLHFCFHPNASIFCSGCLGSPIVTNKEYKTLLIGVIIWTGCVEAAPWHMGVKLALFDGWIRSNSLIGFDHQKKK